MGKAANQKKKAARKLRNDPTGLAGAADDVNVTMSAGAAKPEVFPVVKKLQSDSVDDRAWAATTLSNLVLEPDMRKKLLASQVLGPLLTLLRDAHAEVVVEATGALRNLVVAGGEEVCGDLVRNNALPALLGLLEKVKSWISARLADVQRVAAGETVAPLADKKELANRAACFDIAEQLVAVLWSLSEAFDEAVRLVTSSPAVFPFLMELLNPDHELPWKLVQIAGQCLNTLTDENPACYGLFVQHPEYAERIAAIASGSVSGYSTWDENRMLLRPLCGNILFNIRSALLDQSQFAGHVLYGSIYNSITAALDYDVAEALTAGMAIEKAMEATEAMEPPKEDRASVDIQELVQKENSRMAVLEGNLETVQLALELLANVVVVEEGEGWENADEEDGMDENEENGDDDDDDVAMMEADTEVLEAMHEVSGNGDDDKDGLDPILAMLVDEFPTLFTKVLSLITTAHHNIPTASNLLAHLAIVQTRALTTAANILATPVGPHVLTTPVGASQLWNALFVLLGPAQQAGNMDFVDAALAALLAVLRVTDAHPALAMSVTEGHITVLVNALVAGSAPSGPDSSSASQLPASSLSKCVNILTIIAKQSTSVPITSHIMTTLLALLIGTPLSQHQSASLAAPTTSVPLATDILNAFYDVFPDAETDPTDCVFVDNNMAATLRDFGHTFRAMVRKVDKRKNREVRERGEEALQNLLAFVQYKEGERKAALKAAGAQ
ncbi:hypothetical protein PhCBS80983_g03577 [Powellomyces hirtus]|uniref:SYO1-like TPR repeats domain-containing protein n=1 Tax=Powellomyces hirtus TaxID=109895 RepID=A0A507E136_9FUNG|nr:hypothetical protein PhCBS80983_g03577 [Powellomyces hirtus]